MHVETFPSGALSVITTADGETHRRTVRPGDDLSGEPAAVKAAAAKAWTASVLSAWADQEPQPTPEEVQAAYAAAVDRHVEARARAMGYNGASTLAGYLGSSVPEWAAEAAAFVAWRDAVWVTAIGMLESVDPEAPPSIADVIAGLPEWPGVPE